MTTYVFIEWQGSQGEIIFTCIANMPQQANDLFKLETGANYENLLCLCRYNVNQFPQLIKVLENNEKMVSRRLIHRYV